MVVAVVTKSLAYAYEVTFRMQEVTQGANEKFVYAYEVTFCYKELQKVCRR